MRFLRAPKILSKKDLPELSAEISSMSKLVKWASELNVASLSIEPSSPLNETWSSEVGSSVRQIPSVQVIRQMEGSEKDDKQKYEI